MSPCCGRQSTSWSKFTDGGMHNSVQHLSSAVHFSQGAFGLSHQPLEIQLRLQTAHGRTLVHCRSFRDVKGAQKAASSGYSSGSSSLIERRSRDVKCLVAAEKAVLEEKSYEVFSELSQVCAVLGTQWGDEGKGKLVDILSQRFDIVARCQVCAPAMSRAALIAVVSYELLRSVRCASSGQQLIF